VNVKNVKRKVAEIVSSLDSTVWRCSDTYNHQDSNYDQNRSENQKSFKQSRVEAPISELMNEKEKQEQSNSTMKCPSNSHIDIDADSSVVISPDILDRSYSNQIVNESENENGNGEHNNFVDILVGDDADILDLLLSEDCELLSETNDYDPSSNFHTPTHSNCHWDLDTSSCANISMTSTESLHEDTHSASDADVDLVSFSDSDMEFSCVSEHD